jgi:hypothetical protein
VLAETARGKFAASLCFYSACCRAPACILLGEHWKFGRGVVHIGAGVNQFLQAFLMATHSQRQQRGRWNWRVAVKKPCVSCSAASATYLGRRAGNIRAGRLFAAAPGFATGHRIGLVEGIKKVIYGFF